MNTQLWTIMAIFLAEICLAFYAGYLWGKTAGLKKGLKMAEEVVHRILKLVAPLVDLDKMGTAYVAAAKELKIDPKPNMKLLKRLKEIEKVRNRIKKRK